MEKNSELLTNKEFNEDFKKIDTLESNKKPTKKENDKNELLKAWVEEFSFENKIDNNFL